MNRAFAAYWLAAGVLVLGFNVSGAMAVLSNYAELLLEFGVFIF
jgi:hypothetical protein